MNFKFFREVKDQIIFSGHQLKIYLPKFYFKEEIAIQRGSKIESLGIFDFEVFATEQSDGDLYQLNLPVSVLLNYNNMEEEKLTLSKEHQEDSYFVLLLEKGDTVIENLNVQEDADSTKSFVKLLHGGKLPNNILYGKVINIFKENLAINKVNLGVPSFILECIISEIYRDKRDLETPFRKVIGKPSDKISEKDYQTINIKKIPHLNSTFTSITFEDINQSITSSIKKSKSDFEEKESPIEKTIKY